MKTFLFSIILLTTIHACGQMKTRSQADFDNMLDDMYQKTVPLIQTEELKKQDSDSYVILDTREKEEYNVSHLPGAIWVGYDDLQKERIAQLDKGKPVLVYCSVGYRSEKVGEKLQKMGFGEVRNLYGGIFDWKNKGEKVFDNSEKATEKVHTYNRTWSQWLRVGEKIY